MCFKKCRNDIFFRSFECVLGAGIKALIEIKWCTYIAPFPYERLKTLFTPAERKHNSRRVWQPLMYAGTHFNNAGSMES